MDEAESFIDGTYVPAQKGGACTGKSRAGTSTKLMAVADSEGLPLSVHIDSGSRHDVALVEATKNRRQDGRTMRRYKRRWKVERLFAWLKNFRRVSTRWEQKADNYLGFVHLGCVLILVRTLLSE